MRVTNTGGADALNVIGVTPTVATGSGSVSLLTSPAPQNIPGGNNFALFTWTYSATAAGTVQLTSIAYGYDENSGDKKESNIATSNNILIQTPATLISSIVAYPAPVGIAATITVIMTVTNTGQASANNVTPVAFTVSGSSTYVYDGGPVPNSLTLSAGASGSFTWLYRGITEGTLVFTGKAAGLDANSGFAVSTTVTAQSNIVDVVSLDPKLRTWVTVVPNTVNQNQRYTVILSVSNVGIVAANNTSPGIISGTIGTQISSPSAPWPNIPVGGYYEFTWIYNADTIAGPSNVNVIAYSGGFPSTDVTCCNYNQIQSIANPCLLYTSPSPRDS